MKKSLFIALVLLPVVASLALAAGKDESVLRAETEVKLKQLAVETNTACGSAIAATIDWQSFSSSDWQGYSMASYCGAPLEVLADFCRQEKGNSKAYIKKQIKFVSCVYGGEGQRALIVKNGAITQHVDFKGANLEDFVRAALLKDM